MSDEYTGFSNCKFIAEFERELRLKRITRKNNVKLSTEAILNPKKFLKHIEDIRSKLDF
jgi:hypothetical protein